MMKNIFRIIRNILLVLVGLILAVIVFLIIYYEVQDKKLQKQRAELVKNGQVRLIQADSIAENTATPSLMLLPVPQKFEMAEGFFRIPDTLTLSVTDSLQKAVDEILHLFPDIQTAFSSKDADMVIAVTENLPGQGYRMEIQPELISIEYSDSRGLYYALVSLKVLNRNYNRRIPCVRIEDAPDLAIRGLMLDISRDKIPALHTLKSLVQLLADLKFNHLELYIEGFSFAYPSFQHLWEGMETPVTGNEIRELDSLCKAHFIELVPNQNSLGHMMAWLATDEYDHLAECPDGYKFMGLINMKGTLDPTHPESIGLVSGMTDDLLPFFTSDKFNVNLDEPFELGQGKSKKLAARRGVEEVYLDYALKIYDMATRRKKEMLMWGDIVLRYPQILKRLPRDVTLLDWGYEASYPFERNCKMLQSSGLQYMVCPGTSSWTSITGRTNNMLGNIASAAANGVKYDARGMLLTDWGDMGHWQYLPVSYAPYVTGAALSWNSKNMNEMPLVPFLNSYIFQDERQIMGDLVLDMGRYKQYEEIPVPNMTTTMLALQFGLNDKLLINAIYEKISTGLVGLMKEIAPEMTDDYLEKYETRQLFDFSGLFSFLDQKEALLNSISLRTAESQLIEDEYRNALRLIRVGAGLQYYIQERHELTRDEQKNQLYSLRTMLGEYLNENHRLWMIRNKPGGYERSTAALNKLLLQIEKQITLSEKPVISRGMHRLFEKITTAAAVLYIKAAK